MSLVAIALGSILMSMPTPAGATAGYVSLADFDGCWAGTGDVTGLEVTAKLKVSPILSGTHRLFEVESRLNTNANDRYSAHIIVAETADVPGVLISYYADSFGGDFAASGKGTIEADGLSIEYARPSYPEVNQWKIDGSVLRWTNTVVRALDDQLVAHTYEMSRVGCTGA